MRVVAVCGTRPDAIKMAPVVKELQRQDDIETLLVASGQHREMLQQVLDAFGLSVAANFDVMKREQSLAYITSAVLEAMDRAIAEMKPDIVIAQGDTTTTMAAALTAFYRRIPFAHVEAGLRTETIESPFPEEFNRRATSLIASLHFAPTDQAADNLYREGIARSRVYVTGNTSIDAILDVTSRLGPAAGYASGRMLLVTTHRRENWGEPQRAICRALKRLLNDFPDIHVVLPMHKNPVVREVLESEFGVSLSTQPPNPIPISPASEQGRVGDTRVFLIEPPDYPDFAQLMMASHLILTDSGGVQEEAPSLGKPVLVLRSETERPEGIDAGNAVLVGTSEDKIYAQAARLLTDSVAYDAMAQARNPYGEGNAAQRIVAVIRKFTGLS